MADKKAHWSATLSDSSTRNICFADSICEALLECSDCKPVDPSFNDHLFTPSDADREEEIQQLNHKLEQLLDKLNDEIPAVSPSDYLNRDKTIILNTKNCMLRKNRFSKQTA